MNTTKGIFTQFERDELNKITAKSILEKLMNIRQKIDAEFTARRLVWELIQNAKDNVSLSNKEGERVNINISLTENEFAFSHNKGYFTNEHIRGLIRKYSSSDKNREADDLGKSHKVTGRFGTGFMTTHLLSEKVKVISHYKSDDLSLKPFSFWLNRSGKGEKEIIDGINEAFEEADTSITNSSSIRLDNEILRTSFIYPLSDKKKSLAAIAFEEVRKGIAYTLINVSDISSVTLCEDLVDEVIYSIKQTDTKSYLGSEILIFNLLVNGEETENYYVSTRNTSVQIILPILYNEESNNYSVQQLDGSIPRLHLDFPMIGTEDLHLPFIINSSLFEPTEPRDGVSLIDDDDNEFSKLNCKLVLQAVELYKVLLSYIEQNTNWGDLYNLARIKNPKQHSWIDNNWFCRNVVEDLRKKLLYINIVDITEDNRISMWNENGENQVYFPHASNRIVRKKLWKLLKKLYPQSVPMNHIEEWDEIIWSDCYSFSISNLSQEIEKIGSLSNLSEQLEKEEEKAITFLNDYYNLLNVEKNHVKEIATDEFAVIPNQLGDFQKKTKLYVDKNIDEEVKNVCSFISQNPREYLIHKRIFTGSGIEYHIKKQDDIISEINSIIKEGNNDNISDSCDYLASLFPDTNITEKRLSIFEFSRRVYPDDFSKKRKIIYPDDKLWEESDKKSLFYIVSKIANYKNIEKAVEELTFKDKGDFLIWLDSLILFLLKEKFENNINREKYPILPNQNGHFCSKEHLFLDDGNIDEILKDISEELGYDFRDEFLDKSIFLKLPENRTYTIENVAEKISAFVKPILRDIDKRKEHKETLKKLYVWMNENKEKSNTLFSDLFERRFLFLEDDDISLNMKKATELDQLLEEHGIENMEDLRIQLSKLTNNSNDFQENEDEKIDITREILVSLGISSPEQLEEAFKDPTISSRFYHTSTHTIDMFIYAQGLIERTKQNIIKLLENHPDYDCTDLEETAHTTLAGIIKNGVPIQIVTRPSDNGEVIVYYSSEKDTLDSDNSELWVDNGVDEPHILTLGRILKSTGINRIPINMN
ncbi:hypothetical protein CJ739_621 [Mariniflexile rhizosphaerae]|uniref:sacsin N-terminal ATP-binding-like domain-containing protein n=1 Tax=unclassified Mariniflexile TaxID=2643887 RepID=UPI000E32D650|nr:hypothetical protein [Mariniflexile sp. TRM1-10]AXP79718.1 hypothetical protein CJ739_621 [Mariniflexile sp. TRM1-10]